MSLREVAKKIPFMQNIRIAVRRRLHKAQRALYPTFAFYLHKFALRRVIAKKTPLNVVFMVSHESVWKLDRLY
jgi:hypothetical protein